MSIVVFSYDPKFTFFRCLRVQISSHKFPWKWCLSYPFPVQITYCRKGKFRNEKVSPIHRSSVLFLRNNGPFPSAADNTGNQKLITEKIYKSRLQKVEDTTLKSNLGFVYISHFRFRVDILPGSGSSSDMELNLICFFFYLFEESGKVELFVPERSF